MSKPSLKRQASFKGKQPWKKQRVSPMNLNRELRVAAVRQSAHTDFKVVDLISGNQAVSTAGLMNSLTLGLARGTDYYGQFSGGRIFPASIQTKWSVNIGPGILGLGDATNLCRFILFQWDDNTPPTEATLLQGAPFHQSPINLNAREICTVFHDETVALTQYAGAVIGFDNKCGKFYIKGKKMLPVEFVSGATTISKGGLYMFVVTDSAIAPAPNVNYYCRLTFTDS